MVDECHTGMLKIRDMFSSYNNFDRDQKNTPMSYGDKRKQEETLLKFTHSFITTSETSIETTQESLSQVDDLMDEDGQHEERKERFQAHLLTLAAAYYNMGASCEHIGKLDLALMAFHGGLGFCQKYIPECSIDLTQTLQQSIDSLRSKYSVFQTHSLMRQMRRDDLAPRSLDPQRLESVRETRQLKAKKLASQWIGKPVKARVQQDW